MRDSEGQRDARLGAGIVPEPGKCYAMLTPWSRYNIPMVLDREEALGCIGQGEVGQRELLGWTEVV